MTTNSGDLKTGLTTCSTGHIDCAVACIHNNKGENDTIIYKSFIFDTTAKVEYFRIPSRLSIRRKIQN